METDLLLHGLSREQYVGRTAGMFNENRDRRAEGNNNGKSVRQRDVNVKALEVIKVLKGFRASQDGDR